LKADVDPELPPITEVTLQCRFEHDQRQLYERIRNTYRKKVLQVFDDDQPKTSSLSVLEALLRLRQTCCDPGLLPFPEARKVTHSAKKARFLEILTQLLGEGRRILVFSQWTKMLGLIRAELDALSIEYAYMDGSTRDRTAVVESFQASDGPGVFLISLKAGGLGLNLTAADTVIHYDPWWNPATEEQAADRAHRIGQTRPVLVVKLVVEDTVEDAVLQLQERKRGLARSAIEADVSGIKSLSRDDLISIFGDGGAEELELNVDLQ
jgi:SNF2 family DNA or RNA helicase